MTSLAQATYKKPTNFKPSQIPQRSMADHFSFSQEGDKIVNKTTYSTTIKNHEAQASPPKKPDGQGLQSSSFVIGNQNVPLASESQSQYY